LLKYLRILDLRLEGDDAVGRTSLVARLVPLTGDAAADDLRRRLNELSAGYEIGSAVVTEENLRRDLFGAARVAASRTRVIYERRPTPPETSAETKPAYGRLVESWDPVELGVHHVIGGGPMPAYIRRPHDEVLRAVLDPGAVVSRLVVVRGGSSTG
jgi:hypothetical protein